MDCRWWKLFLWQLVTLVEGFFLFFFFMLGEGFGITFWYKISLRAIPYAG